jgi:hypothetical protein
MTNPATYKRTEVLNLLPSLGGTFLSIYFRVHGVPSEFLDASLSKKDLVSLMRNYPINEKDPSLGKILALTDLFEDRSKKSDSLPRDYNLSGFLFYDDQFKENMDPEVWAEKTLSKYPPEDQFCLSKLACKNNDPIQKKKIENSWINSQSPGVNQLLENLRSLALFRDEYAQKYR